MIANLGHHGHMTWSVLNIPHNFPSQDVIVAPVWYILNILNMHRFGIVMIFTHFPLFY